MALTGIPLLVLTIAATVAVLGGGVLLWNRGRGWRLPVRVVTIVTCEALVAFAVLLVVNRSLDLFPSWSALLNKVPTAAAVKNVGRARLDAFINAEESRRHRDDLVFSWSPAGLAGWGLSGRPQVYVPPAYLGQPNLAFPVVVAVAAKGTGPAQAAWDDRLAYTLARDAEHAATPAVVVLVRCPPAAGLASLAKALPDALAGDLRVSSTGWVLLGAGAPAVAAVRVAATADRYRGAGAVVSAASGRAAAPSATLVRTLRASPTSYPVLVVAGSAGDLAGHGELGRLATSVAGRTRPAPRPSTSARRAGLSPGTPITVVPVALVRTGPDAAAGVPTPPAGVATPAARGSGLVTSGGTADTARGPSITVRVVSRPADRLAAALRWADLLLPPPLARPITVVPPVPVFRHPAACPTPTVAGATGTPCPATSGPAPRPVPGMSRSAVPPVGTHRPTTSPAPARSPTPSARTTSTRPPVPAVR